MTGFSSGYSPFRNTETNLRPFGGATEIVLAKVTTSLKGIQEYTDNSFLNHLIIIHNDVYNAFLNKPIVRRTIVEAIVVLQSLIERSKSEQWNVSMDLQVLALQMFLKNCAELLAVFNQEDTNLAQFLHVLSISSCRDFNFKDSDISAFSASMALHCLSAIESDMNTLKKFFQQDQLAEHIIELLFPEEITIGRLHGSLFNKVLDKFEGLDIAITTDHVNKLTKKVLPYLEQKEILRVLVMMASSSVHNFISETVFNTVFTSLSSTSFVNFDKSDANSFTAKDAELYLVHLNNWSSLSVVERHLVLQKLPITLEQYKLWTSIVQFMKGERSPSILMALTKVMDCTRLRNSTCVKLFYEVLKWMRSRLFDEEWIMHYANKIENAIVSCAIPTSRRGIFEITTNFVLDVIEEEYILDEVLRMKAFLFIKKSQPLEGERLLVARISKNKDSILREFYVKWNETASEKDKQYIREKVSTLKGGKHRSPIIRTDSNTSLNTIDMFGPNDTQDLLENNDNTISDRTIDMFGRSPAKDRTLNMFGRDDTPETMNTSIDIFGNNKTIQSPDTTIDMFERIPKQTEMKSPVNIVRKVMMDAETNTPNGSFLSVQDCSFKTIQTHLQSGNTSFATDAYQTPDKNFFSPDQTGDVISPAPDEPFNSTNVSCVSEYSSDSTENDKDDDSFLLEMMEQKLENTKTMIGELKKEASPRSTATSPYSPTKEEYQRRIELLERKLKQLTSGSRKPEVNQESDEVVVKELERSIANELQQCVTPTAAPLNSLPNPRRIIFGTKQFTPSPIAQQNQQQQQQLTCAHPGQSGLCLGCLSDEKQDAALRILHQMSEDWNIRD